MSYRIVRQNFLLFVRIFYCPSQEKYLHQAGLMPSQGGPFQGQAGSEGEGFFLCLMNKDQCASWRSLIYQTFYEVCCQACSRIVASEMDAIKNNISAINAVVIIT